MWCIDIDTHKMTDEKLAKELKTMIKTLGVDLLSVLSTERYNNGLDGYSSLLKSEYKEELIGNFKNTFVEITKSGGMHVLFKKRDGVNYSQKPSVLPSIDIKAHDNNYVKIFPSDGREVLKAVKNLPYYNGKFEEEIFKPKENFTTYFSGSIVKPKSTGNHEGREAYERVATGTSYNRNDDLFKGACWAFENDIDIDDLSSVIGTVKGRDVFTREEFELTIESAKRKVGTRYSISY
ncbi:replication protein [Streptococcus phage Javan411]|uniref:Primase alpha helix C-terminal domain protein n=2 Tax=Streptococcus parauberis TaxID=1348 RepID=F1Z0R5_9STRE|nr:primase alpha helix C-terminal domain protein [Streptococcus parauberis NCFD 2020]QBX18312.1 replication protein [Streptococcus phage Javan411]QBX27635.1 replication protein [Streptococcus phage Javan400]